MKLSIIKVTLCAVPLLLVACAVPVEGEGEPDPAATATSQTATAPEALSRAGARTPRTSIHALVNPQAAANGGEGELGTGPVPLDPSNPNHDPSHISH
jgi:hypothetical protein